MYKAKTLLLIAVLIVSALHCARAERRYRTVKLHSGKVLKVFSTGRMRFGNGTQAVTIRYETDIPIDDIAALTAEADAIWPDLQPEVERANVEAAILMASPPRPEGFIYRSRSYNFVYLRGGDGTWYRSAVKQ